MKNLENELNGFVPTEKEIARARNSLKRNRQRHQKKIQDAQKNLDNYVEDTKREVKFRYKFSAESYGVGIFPLMFLGSVLIGATYLFFSERPLEERLVAYSLIPCLGMGLSFVLDSFVEYLYYRSKKETMDREIKTINYCLKENIK